MSDTRNRNIPRGKFAEISERYRHPRIKTTKTVRFALLALRIYLLLLVGLLCVKFISLL